MTAPTPLSNGVAEISRGCRGHGDVPHRMLPSRCVAKGCRGTQSSGRGSGGVPISVNFRGSRGTSSPWWGFGGIPQLLLFFSHAAAGKKSGDESPPWLKLTPMGVSPPIASHLVLEQGVPGDAVPWPGARGCPPHSSLPPFLSPPQAGREESLKKHIRKGYLGRHHRRRARRC